MDTSTARGRAMLEMAAVFAKLERAMIQERIKAGIARVQAGGKTKSGNPLGRPRIADTVEARIRELRAEGVGVIKIAKTLGIGVSAVQRVVASSTSSFEGVSDYGHVIAAAHQRAAPVNDHVSADADPDDPRDEANHRRRTFLRGSRRELAQALLLDVLDLLAHHAQPHHIAAQLRAGVLGQRRPFRGAKTVEPFLGLAQRRLKGAD